MSHYAFFYLCHLTPKGVLCLSDLVNFVGWLHFMFSLCFSLVSFPLIVEKTLTFFNNFGSYLQPYCYPFCDILTKPGKFYLLQSCWCQNTLIIIIGFSSKDVLPFGNFLALFTDKLLCSGIMQKDHFFPLDDKDDICSWVINLGVTKNCMHAHWVFCD